MATLEKIRSHGVLLLVIVGLAMLAFILGDFFSSGSTFFNRSQAYVGEIEGQTIDIMEFQKAVDQLNEVYKIETGSSNMDEDQSANLRDQVWQTYLMKYLLEEQADGIGLTVTDNELSELCIGEHPHAIIQQRRAFYDQSGKFNRLALVQFLSSLNQEAQNAEQEAGLQQARTYWMYWENAVRLTHLQEKYTALLQALVGANKLDAQYAFDARQTSCDVAYIMQPYYNVADSLVSVGNGEIKKLYNQKKEQYKQEPNRTLNYIMFPIVPSEQDYAEAEQWINNLAPEFRTTTEVTALVNSNSDVMYDGRNYSVETVPAQYKDFAFAKNAKEGQTTEISFTDDTYSMARIMKCGYNVADSVELRYTIIADAAQLDSLKAEWRKQNYGNASELGWLTATELPKEMTEDLFNAKKNDIVTFAYGEGLQVFQLMDKSAATPKVRLAILERKVTPSSRTYATIYNQAKQFVVNNKTAEAFTEAAREQDFTVYPAYNVLANNHKVASLDQSRAIVRWAFQGDTKQGAVSDVFECGDNFVVAVLSEINDGEYRSVNSVAAELQSELAKEKKAALIAGQLQAATTLEEAAELIGAEVKTAEDLTLSSYRFGENAATEPAVIGTALKLNVEELSAPVEGNSGVYVLKCLAKTTTEGEFNLEQEMQQLNMRYMYSLPYQAIGLLQDKADITDKRANFY